MEPEPTEPVAPEPGAREPDATDTDPAELYPLELRDLIRRGVSRVRRRLREGAPGLSVPTLAWMRSLSESSSPTAYFMHPHAFPMLLLPWLLEERVRGSPDRSFHRDVVYSTLTGYYFVRMIDDLMDREQPPASSVLPALIFFHTEFQTTYHRWFPHGHPLWDALVGASFAAAETASRDTDSAPTDRSRFLAISARKTVGAKIPLAAVAHRYDRADLLPSWSGFVDLLGCWHQMLNDILGWTRDLEQGRRTYFLSQGSSGAGRDAAVAEWVITDGLTWGRAQLDGWMRQLLSMAATLDVPSLMAYLEARQRGLDAEWQWIEESRAEIQRLARALR